ncbi:MAG: glycosyltransferase family 1 protein [Nitrospirota bacterium]
MRIGIDALFVLPGINQGITTYLCNLLKNLLEIDKQNEYILFVGKENKGIFMFDRDRIQEVQCPIRSSLRPLRVFWEQVILPIQVKKYGLDLFFSPGHVSPILCPVRVVETIHDTYYACHPENVPKIELFLWQILNGLSARNADKIITLSANAKRDIVRAFKVKEEKVAVTYAAVEDRFHPHYPEEEIEVVKQKYGLGKKYLLSVAIMRSNKNIQRLFEAFNILKTQYRIEHQLVLVGTVSKEFKGLQKKDVILTGYVPDEELPLLYCGASLLVHPSFFEGFGLPVLEAMACGTPVVASNVTSLPEIIGEAGLLFDPFKPEEMASAVYRILSDKVLQQDLIKKGLQRANEFSWQKTAKQTLTVFEEKGNKTNETHMSCSLTKRDENREDI